MTDPLLTEMDGFESDSGVLELAATNRPEALDPALCRPGRLSQRVHVTELQGRSLKNPRWENSVWSNEDLVEEILLKLPVDSLGKFRAVCSNWNELLRSRRFLQRYEAVHQSRGHWVLRLCERSNRPCNLRPWYFSDDSNPWHKSWRCSHAERRTTPSPWTWSQTLLSDGGLICYEGNVFNPITGSTRHLPGTGYDNWDKNSLKLCAFDVDSTNGVYRVFLIASNKHLLIYDSKANSWSRAQESPIALDVEVPGMILKGGVYFMMRLNTSNPRELKILHYDLRKDQWRSCVISTHWPGFQRHLLQWQNRVYLISMSKLTSTVYVDDITSEGAGCFTPETVCKGNFEDLLVVKFSDLDLHSVRARGDSINFLITGRDTSYTGTLSCQRIRYDLHTREWSLAKKLFNISKRGEIFVGFEPKLSNLA